MSRPVTYTAITTEGGLLSQEALGHIASWSKDFTDLAPASYGYATIAEVTTAVNQAWANIEAHWRSFTIQRQRWQRTGDTGVSDTRGFVQNVLAELGYPPLVYHREAEDIGGRGYAISHRAGSVENATPVHIISADRGIDDREKRAGDRTAPSAGALMQGYLNAADTHLWGMVTNGLSFRLLRENRQIDRVLRIEFNLEDMLERQNFAEFRLMWMLLHKTRFVRPGEPRESALIEQCTRSARDQGDRAAESMRGGVEAAIIALTNGLLSHPANSDLRSKLGNGTLTPAVLYTQVLRLVYRLLFLMVAEERDLLFPPAQTREDFARRDRDVQRYMRNYSVERLRRLAASARHAETHHSDLWQGLLATFAALRTPEKAAYLNLQPLGGIFDGSSCRDIDGENVPHSMLIANDVLLQAIRRISIIRRADGIERRINYRDLDAEELGSVYESLLDQEFSLTDTGNRHYVMAFVSGGDRKTTGSYYTPRSLVQELLNSALDPVIDAAMAPHRTVAGKRAALLELNIIDPACGSGHFLLGAARRIGRRLAELEAGPESEPEIASIRHNTREAIRHCIYGVDKNHLAIDLCKVALWIESHEPGAPLGFLDHHIKRGDSLVGVWDAAMLQGGIPDVAFAALTGDDKAVAADLKKRNKQERPKQHENGLTTARQGDLFSPQDEHDLIASLAAAMDRIETMPDTTLAEVRAKAGAYEKLQHRDDWQEMTIACDLWTYAFYAPKTKATTGLVPTSATVRRLMSTGPGAVNGQMIGLARGASAEVGYFHWWLMYPEVMNDTRGGFDCVLGNPPWERVKLQEKEFFASRSPEIATAANKAARDRLIKNLVENDPVLLQQFHLALHEAEATSVFLRLSGRYPLTGRGDVNLYSVFAEHDSKLVGPTGRAGVIVPTGIATDDSNKTFFAYLVDHGRLTRLLDFENRRKLFQAVDSRMKFALLTMAGGGRTETAFEAGFFLYDPADLEDPEKTFVLTAADIALLNPNTKTVPIFRSERDAELTKAIYRTAPVLINENIPGAAGNPWGIRFNTMFHMSNDSHLFRTREDLEALGATLGADGRWRLRPGDGAVPGSDQEWLPLYEAKLIHQYDHRFATFERNGSTRNVTPSEHRDPDFVVTPRYWVDMTQVRLSGTSHKGGWFLVYRTIARATDVRTMIASVIPHAAIAGSSPLFISERLGASDISVLSSNLNTVCFDFATRQKIGGTDIKFFHLRQLPTLPPSAYSPEQIKLITDRVLRLTYTAHDMAPFARDLGYDGPPFLWDEDERAQLRAELDGIYAHLYGISRDDFAYILDTFPIVRSNDIKQFGEYRTKALCLAAYDRFAPATLRALENRVRDVEIALRRIIVTAANDDPSVLPTAVREKTIATMERQGGDTATTSLREMLHYTTFTDLEKIMRVEPIWEVVGTRFESKRQLEIHVGRLARLRDPLAHARTFEEDTRAKGETALAWLEQRLE